MTLQSDPREPDHDVLVVAPLDRFSLPKPVSQFSLAPDLEIGGTPEFVRSEEATQSLSMWDRGQVEKASYALLHRPERFWQPGMLPAQMLHAQGIQEYMNLALLAIWLAQPSPASCPFLLAYEPRAPMTWRVLRTARAIKPLPSRGQTKTARDDLVRAAGLFLAMSRLRGAGESTSVYLAIRFFWDALHEGNPALRHTLMWIALEALFGTGAGKIVNRLSHRIASFAPGDGESPSATCEMVKNSYDLRSKVIHGSDKADFTGRYGELPLWTEELLRRCLLRILEDDGLVETFTGKRRKEYLEGLLHRGARR